MAANFWQSSHYQQWLLTRQDLYRERHLDLQIFTEEEYQKLMIFFASVMQAISEHLKLKQQVAATAIVYFKRFYIRNSLKCIDPFLMAPTCVFLASKVEEFGLIPHQKIVPAVQTVIKNKFAWAHPQDYTYRVNQIFECEFYLLETMDCCLILYQPYRPLVQYVQDWQTKDSILPVAWNVVNDSFRTDVCFLYPPHQIALACLHMACVIAQKDHKQWFAELNTDLDKLLEITRHILNLYDLWKNFEEKKEIPVLLAKMPKPKSQPSTRTPAQGKSQKNGYAVPPSSSSSSSKSSAQSAN